MSRDSSSIAELFDRARRGQAAAAEELFGRYRERLRRMVAARIDPRLAARVDPSDIVQEALLQASAGLSEYLQAPRIAFYPWLRQIAWDRLIELHRRHVVARRRSVTREEPGGLGINAASSAALARQFAASGLQPSGRLLHEELCRRIQAALNTLAEKDREVLLLRYVEQLPTSEISQVLGVTEGTVKGRHRRAVERLAELLQDNNPREHE